MRIAKALQATVVASKRADDDLRQLEELFHALDQAVIPFLPSEEEVTVCAETAQRLRKGSTSAFEQIKHQVSSWRDTAILRAEQSIGRERLLAALVPLLIHHQLPDSTWDVQLRSIDDDIIEA